MNLSFYGEQVARDNAIGNLIFEIEKTKAQGKVNIDLSSGNPQVFPEIKQLLKEEARSITDSDSFGDILCRYGGIFADKELLDRMIELYQGYGHNFNEHNFMVTPGGMSAIYYALNAYAGPNERGVRKVLFPQCPEFADYFGMGLSKDCYISVKPDIDIIDKHYFRYLVNYNDFDLEKFAVVLISRPCNPSGYVITDDDLKTLIKRAKEKNIIVVIDSAYSLPFPNLIHKDKVRMILDDNVINVMSFSKAGFAGGRIGVAVSPSPELLRPLKIFQLNFCLTAPNLGQILAAKTLRMNKLQSIMESAVKPFYQQRIHLLQKTIAENVRKDIPYYFHIAEGGMFQWIWFKDLPISDFALYERLKSKGVYITPGCFFFSGVDKKTWKHTSECVRLSLTAPEADLVRGLKILCDTVNDEYR